MNQLVQRFKRFVGGDDPKVLFGDGANNGQFGKLRGCGVKGPALADKLAIVQCSEFRTSKLCLECGHVAKFYHHGVT
jgi:hypothetical protein